MTWRACPNAEPGSRLSTSGPVRPRIFGWKLLGCRLLFSQAGKAAQGAGGLARGSVAATSGEIPKRGPWLGGLRLAWSSGRIGDGVRCAAIYRALVLGLSTPSSQPGLASRFLVGVLRDSWPGRFT